MRYAVKIKCGVLLLAWMVIFLHSIVPHHHHSHHPDCHYVVHKAAIQHEHHDDCDHEATDFPLYQAAQNSETETICHFDTSLFQNFHIDNFFVAESGWSSSQTSDDVTELSPVVTIFKKPPAFRSCMLLRAPPYMA